MRVDASRDEIITCMLRAAGLRSTAQRRVILAHLVGSSHALTAQQLHARLCDDGHGVGLNTAYRTVQALVDAGALHTFPDHGELAFRRCGDAHHHHFICQRCGRVEDVLADEVERWVTAVAQRPGYTVHSHRADVYGTCPAC